jgi:hypothetical protein
MTATLSTVKHFTVREDVVRACSLDQALSYQNRDIIHRFEDDFSVTSEEAHQIFEDTKKLLWLYAHCYFDGIPGLPPPLIVDEMWHIFILFSREYCDYCFGNFGGYIHHVPTTRTEKLLRDAEQERAPQEWEARTRALLQKRYDYVYDKLGADVLKRWYLEYPNKYNMLTIYQLRRAPGGLGVAVAADTAAVRVPRETR